MREIITIQVGQCGNRMGNQFWNTIRADHGIDESGTFVGMSDLQAERTNVFFRENRQGLHTPRAVLADLDGMSLDPIRSTGLFQPASFVAGRSGTGSNWATGHYGEGSTLAAPAMDVIRKQAESCECLQGVQFMFSAGGGTGSGMGTLLLSKIREEYPDRMTFAYPVFPSSYFSSALTEAYNAVVSIHHLTENCDAACVLDNQALYHLCYRNKAQRLPDYNSLNSVVAEVMSGVTASLRFPGQLNCDLRKMAVNLVPFPRLHFFTVSHYPLCRPTHESISIDNCVKALFSPESMLCSLKQSPFDSQEGGTVPHKYLTASLLLRGHMSSREVEFQLLEYQNKHSANFVGWIPNNLLASMCDVPAPDQRLTGTLIGSNFAIQTVLKRSSEMFSSLYQKKAFVHWYVAEGMDELELEEAESNCNDLISEYYQSNPYGVDDFDDDEDWGEEFDDDDEAF